MRLHVDLTDGLRRQKAKERVPPLTRLINVVVEVVSFALNDQLLDRGDKANDGQLDFVRGPVLSLEGQLDRRLDHSVLEGLQDDGHEEEFVLLVNNALSVRFEALCILVEHLSVVRLVSIPIPHHKVQPHVVEGQHDFGQVHLLNVVSIADIQRHRECNRVKVEGNHAEIDDAWHEFYNVEIDSVVERYAHNMTSV